MGPHSPPEHLPDGSYICTGIDDLGRPHTSLCDAKGVTSLDAAETEWQQQRDTSAAGFGESPQPAILFRHSGWHRDRALVASSLWRTAAARSRRDNFGDCGAHSYVLESVDAPGTFKVAGSHCHDRFCLPCATGRATLIAGNVLTVVADKTLRFFTLSIQTDNLTLAESLQKLYVSFSKLRRTLFWRSRVNGGVAFLEITWNNELKRWHPHLHCLLEGRWLDKQVIRRMWYRITGDSYIVHISLIRDRKKCSEYVTKYASKPFNNTFLHNPSRLDEAVLALAGRKLLATFGCWRGHLLTDPEHDDGWLNLGSLDTIIASAANGDSRSMTILNGLNHPDIDKLLDMIPRPPPNVPDLPSETQLQFADYLRRAPWGDP